jgi:hypothetical protein
MRLLTLLLTSCLASAPALGQDEKPAPQQPTAINLPVSLDKIREGLSQPESAEPLKGLNVADLPTFRIDVTEQQKFEELLSKIKFDRPGPQVPGGIYAYDQHQRLFPRVDNPRVQPYGAFTTGEISTLGGEALIERYIVERMAHIVGGTLRAQAEREAREEVARALAGYLAAQPSPSSGTQQPGE